MSKPEQDELRKQITDLLAKGLIEPSSSPYAAPVLFVQKKSGELRMCIDYRQLNKITIRDQYPLPRIDDLFDQLAGKTVFSSLDLQAGYHQIRIPAEDVPKTAFRTPMGHYQFKVLCFGLTNAPATFQRVMNEAFAEVINDCALVYLDDILVMSKDSEEHLVHLRRVFDLLRKNKFYAKLSKCEFMQRTLKFLGHIISAQGISVDPCKVTAISEWPVPTSLKTLQSFLGAANYVRKFVHNFSTIAAPLTNLTGPKKESFPWKAWPQAELDAFNALKQAISNVPMLKLPDHSKPFQVHCDASLEGIGAVLMQDGYPLAYYSRKLIPAEINYTTGEQELLALVSACQQWRCYLEGVPFTLAYAADSNFTKRRKTKNLYLDEHGLWRHQKRRTVIVPRDKQLREHILHEMHDAKVLAPQPQGPGTTPQGPGPQGPGTTPQGPGTTGSWHHTTGSCVHTHRVLAPHHRVLAPQGPGTTPQGPGYRVLAPHHRVLAPQGPGTTPQGPGPQGPGTTPQGPGTTPQGPGTTPQGPGPQGPGTTPQGPASHPHHDPVGVQQDPVGVQQDPVVWCQDPVGVTQDPLQQGQPWLTVSGLKLDIQAATLQAAKLTSGQPPSQVCSHVAQYLAASLARN
ncbi:hypothetical protein QJQ45_003665 [Haematococcus lacustris]|nr:hypothetical protein QJQ45_003665 [Haematococcus lacustris]